MKKIYLFAVMIMSVLLSASFALAVNGASTVDVENSTTAAITAATSTPALAGNVTELVISGSTTTQTWTGFFGNVSGAIELSDAAGKVMYNWSAANPSGKVLASVNQTVDWSNIACASAANITALETAYQATGTDGVDETFVGTAGSHIIAGSTLDSCSSTNVYDSTGTSGSSFEELLLWDGEAAVFASILENDATGYDNKSHDFEMLVLEDGHGNSDTKDYYFFVELD
ncbi:MAG: hypothetical protein PF542_02285 [Nanoarchaeota archaeon]|jgi:hypothetical protein|nr:hypothetical protein [Nanoarchaeota archaeon]